MRIINFIVAAIILLSFSGCSIYKINIRQGNIIEQKHVSQVRKGMTKAQVQYLLGKPLVNDTFGDSKWHYVNTFKSGQTGEQTRQQLFITFENDKVVSMSGDFELPEGFNG